MTIKELADDLGVDKEKIKYLWRQLPSHWSVMIQNKFYLSDAAVDAIKNKLSGGELDSDIPVQPFSPYDTTGWGNIGKSRGFGAVFTDFNGGSTDTGDSSVNCGDGDFGETGSETGKNGENDGKYTLTIFDYFKSTIDIQTSQLEAKDEQIRALTAQIDKLTTAISERDTAEQTAASEQLTAKDAQLSRMQDTIDALTKQLSDAAERERQLQATLEQSREQPRKWWQWWKR